MRVAVLTLTRDRLSYTQHCFERLRTLAGCSYDHYVLDQDSQDGTVEWLEANQPEYLFLRAENIGIPQGMNFLLDHLEGPYDVVVKFDNDCELLQPDTLRSVCELVLAAEDAFLSPRILGLKRPPLAQGEFVLQGETILDIPQIGGIFLAVPGWVYSEYRYPETGPMWGIDDVDICRWWRDRGGRCGYVKSLTANHYETTEGQWQTFPEYFERTLAEGKPSL